MFTKLDNLPDEVRAHMRQNDWQTFGIAVLLTLGCFYGLFVSTAISADQKGALFGLLGIVATYFLTRSTASNAVAGTMRALNGGSGDKSAAPITAEHAVVVAHDATITAPPHQ